MSGLLKLKITEGRIRLEEKIIELEEKMGEVEKSLDLLKQKRRQIVREYVDSQLAEIIDSMIENEKKLEKSGENFKIQKEEIEKILNDLDNINLEIK